MNVCLTRIGKERTQSHYQRWCILRKREKPWFLPIFPLLSYLLSPVHASHGAESSQKPISWEAWEMQIAGCAPYSGEESGGRAQNGSETKQTNVWHVLCRMHSWFTVKSFEKKLRIFSLPGWRSFSFVLLFVCAKGPLNA